MSDIEISNSDDSDRPEDNGDVSESEDYSSMDSDILESDDESEREDYSSMDSDDESSISLGGGWSHVDVFGDKRPDPLPPLRQSYCGVNPELGIDSECSVIECVKKFITGDVIAHITECTNERAKLFFEENPELGGKIKKLKWRDVTMDEFHVFLALYIYTGQCRFREMNQYWSRKPYEPGVHFYCSSIMSRDRYLSIMKFLRFTLPENVKKGVPSTYLDAFCRKILVPMMENVDAGKYIAIDEAVVLWKGRLGFRQFIKSKCARFGIKVFAMCNSEKEWSGYCYNFQIYCGKETCDNYVLPNVPGANELSSSEKIVVHLANSVLEQGRHIFVDNWYSSSRLAHFLLKRETLMTGTLPASRGGPAELNREKLGDHQAAFVRKDNTLIVKWSDKREVYVISTCYDSTLFVKKQQVLPGGKKINYKKPHMIEKHNDFMAGVDKADQLLEPIDPSRKSMAWFKKLGLHFIMILLLNSFLVYKNKVNKKCTFKRYILQAVEQIIDTHSPQGIEVKEKYVAANPRAGRKKKREEVIHAFLPLPPVPGGSRKPRKRCRVCGSKAEKRTRYCCHGCSEKPGLCSIEHFKEWHSDSGGPSTSQ